MRERARPLIYERERANIRERGQDRSYIREQARPFIYDGDGFDAAEGEVAQRRCRVLLRVSVFGFRISGFGFRFSVFGFRVSGFGFRFSGFREREHTLKRHIATHPKQSNGKTQRKRKTSSELRWMLMKCDFAGGDERIFEGPRVVMYIFLCLSAISANSMVSGSPPGHLSPIPITCSPRISGLGLRD